MTIVFALIRIVIPTIASSILVLVLLISRFLATLLITGLLILLLSVRIPIVV